MAATAATELRRLRRQSNGGAQHEGEPVRADLPPQEPARQSDESMHCEPALTRADSFTFNGVENHRANGI